MNKIPLSKCIFVWKIYVIKKFGILMFWLNFLSTSFIRVYIYTLLLTLIISKSDVIHHFDYNKEQHCTDFLISNYSLPSDYSQLITYFTHIFLLGTAYLYIYINVLPSTFNKKKTDNAIFLD